MIPPLMSPFFSDQTNLATLKEKEENTKEGSGGSSWDWDDYVEDNPDSSSIDAWKDYYKHQTGEEMPEE